MLELGKMAGKRGTPLPIEMLTDSVPGKFYHMSIETGGITNEEAAASTLVNKLYEEFKAEVIWIKVDGKNVELQLSGSPFVWAALIPFIPTILNIIGITVVLVAVYSIMSAIPGWAWGLLIIGGSIIFIGPSIAKELIGEKKYGRRR